MNATIPVKMYSSQTDVVRKKDPLEVTPAEREKIFNYADLEMEKRYPKPPKWFKPREIPMPYIDTRTNNGPLVITEDWYWKQKTKQTIKRAKDKKQDHIEMIQLLARRDMLRAKLGELDIRKKKDAKKIAVINIKLKDIDAELQMLEMHSGIKVHELDKGTRFNRFVGRVKRVARNIFKKVKKYFKENGEFLLNMAAIIVPALVALNTRPIAASR